jgi:hypothetical protein
MRNKILNICLFVLMTSFACAPLPDLPEDSAQQAMQRIGINTGAHITDVRPDLLEKVWESECFIPQLNNKTLDDQYGYKFFVSFLKKDGNILVSLVTKAYEKGNKCNEDEPLLVGEYTVFDKKGLSPLVGSVYQYIPPSGLDKEASVTARMVRYIVMPRGVLGAEMLNSKGAGGLDKWYNKATKWVSGKPEDVLQRTQDSQVMDVYDYIVDAHGLVYDYLLQVGVIVSRSLEVLVLKFDTSEEKNLKMTLSGLTHLYYTNSKGNQSSKFKFKPSTSSFSLPKAYVDLASTLPPPLPVP